MDTPITSPSKLWRADELWASPEDPPAEPGLYGWYFDRAPAHVPTDGCLAVDERWLLYVGISPARPGSRAHLRKRLRQHFHGNARGSTLRKTLGCLLQEELQLEFRRISAKSMRFIPEAESRLSQWMAEHARVTWMTTPEPWVLEERLIEELSLPLNLRGNESHPFHPVLKTMRAAMDARARAGLLWRPGP